MAFDCIDNGGRSSAIPADKVAMGLYARGGQPGELNISVGADVATRLRWGQGTQVLLMEGSGTDAGLVKLVTAPAGQRGYTLTRPAQTRTLSVKITAHRLRHHDHDGLAHASTTVAFQAFGGEMLIMLPEWLKPKQVAA